MKTAKILWSDPPRAVYRIAFIMSALTLWIFSSTILFPDIIPSVGGTFEVLWKLVTSGDFYYPMWLTMQRVFLGFTLAFCVALPIGMAMGRFKKVEAYFEIFIIIGTSQPGLFVSMIILVVLGLKDSTAILTLAYLTIPIITVSIWQGAKNLDTSYTELADVFGFGRLAKIRHVILPQLAGPALAAVRGGLGLTWKYVVMVEMIGLSSGVGYEVTRNFQLFDLESVVAWTIGFLALVLAIEYLVIRGVERWIFSWRDKPTGRVKMSLVPATAQEEKTHV